MNTPNKLTVLRIILVPFFVAVLLLPQIPHHYIIAAIIFGAASYTDHLDGKIARKNNLITDFGKFADPLADKNNGYCGTCLFCASWFDKCDNSYTNSDKRIYGNINATCGRWQRQGSCRQ